MAQAVAVTNEDQEVAPSQEEQAMLEEATERLSTNWYKKKYLKYKKWWLLEWKRHHKYAKWWTIERNKRLKRCGTKLVELPEENEEVEETPEGEELAEVEWTRRLYKKWYNKYKKWWSLEWHRRQKFKKWWYTEYKRNKYHRC